MTDVVDSDPPAHASAPGPWRQLTIALLVGSTVMGSMAFLATLFQTPGLEGPVQVAPIALVVTVLSATALPLVRWDNPAGYALAVLAGAAAVGGIALYLLGAFGPTRTAPAAYLFALLGAVLVVASVAAWRERSPGRSATAATSTAR